MFVFYGKWLTKKQTGWISGQPPSYSAAGLDPTCLHKHKCGSHTERVKAQITFLSSFHCQVNKVATTYLKWRSARTSQHGCRTCTITISWRIPRTRTCRNTCAASSVTPTSACTRAPLWWCSSEQIIRGGAYKTFWVLRSSSCSSSR